MFKRYIHMFFCLLLLFVMTSCQNNKNSDGNLALIRTTNPPPVSTEYNGEKERKAKAIKKDILSLNEIYDVTVVIGKKDVLVAYKVKHLSRFKMKDIEKKINERLEKKYPNENFTVSSDYKIFLEAVRLKDRIENELILPDEAEKQLQSILKLKREKT